MGTTVYGAIQTCLLEMSLKVGITVPKTLIEKINEQNIDSAEDDIEKWKQEYKEKLDALEEGKVLTQTISSSSQAFSIGTVLHDTFTDAKKVFEKSKQNLATTESAIAKLEASPLNERKLRMIKEIAGLYNKVIKRILSHLSRDIARFCANF